MITTFQPPFFAPEYRFAVPSKTPNETIIFISGEIDTTGAKIIGNQDAAAEFVYTEVYPVEIIIGPYVKSIIDTVPILSITGYENTNSDEDDEQKFAINLVRWSAHQIMRGGQPFQELKVSFNLHVAGPNSRITRLNYSCVMIAIMDQRLDLDQKTLLQIPGPTHPQGILGRTANPQSISKGTFEFRHDFQVNKTETIVVVSGMKETNASWVGSDDFQITYPIEALIGPAFAELTNASLLVYPRYFGNSNSDEDEMLGWELENYRWEKFPEQNSIEFRVKLQLILGLQGENSAFDFGYLLYISGKLGERGLNDKNQDTYKPYTPSILPDLKQYTSFINFNNKMFEREARLVFELIRPEGMHHVQVQGLCNFTRLDFTGDNSLGDAFPNFYIFQIVVGPTFRKVVSAVPSVFLTGFENTNSDEDDQTSYNNLLLEWHLVGGFGPGNDEYRIVIQVGLIISGASSKFLGCEYSLSIVGQLGEVGLNEHKYEEYKPNGK